MVKCERSDWTGLERFAREHLTRFPGNAQALLALGLALHRQGTPAPAAIAFDSALAKLPYAEHRRLDRPGRVVPPPRASQTDMSWAGARTAFASLFWGMGDPAWSDGVSERRVEFRARVAFAEFRWTVEDTGIRGADTERGDIHIRYGPPDMVAVFGPNVMENAADVMTFWMYKSGMIFAFSSMSGFSTARIPPADRAMIDGVIDAQPARWDNLASPPVDSIITRLAQFRAGIDSVEIVVASLAPLRAVTGGNPATGIRGRIWLLSSAGLVAYRDSSAISEAGTTGWIAGVSTAYEYLMRVETIAADSQTHARFQKYLRKDSTLSTAGPGMSDVLVASSVAEPVGQLKRWRDARPSPSVGALDPGQKLWLIWENYDFAAENGSIAYDVLISVKRVRSGVGRLVASATGALADIARISLRDDEADVHYTRTAPQSSVAVEAVSLDLLTTPPGDYSVTIQVTDRTGQRTMHRTVMVAIRG